MHFEGAELAPVHAFWSVTMYNDEQLFADNPIDRYAIGDRDPLELNSDGSLDIFIQRSPPSGGKSSWPTEPAEVIAVRLRPAATSSPTGQFNPARLTGVMTELP